MERSKPTKTSKERQEKVTIYFDKRALEEQKKEEEELRQEELDKKAKKERDEEKGKEVVNAIGNLFLSPLALMLVWNACIPGLFGLATLGYWSAMGLYVVFRILLRNS